jgi:UDP-2,3-diacylglucosamine pyrophosphatase LpxH
MFQVVVISDLHLGEDLSVDASEQTIRDVAMASAAAADFLAHLTLRRVDGRPWRLVCNGDLFDFLTMPVRTAEAGAAYVDRIAERHPVFFRALGKFLAAGNRCDIIAGNHDREVTHPLIADRVRAAMRARGVKEQALHERLGFHDWFVHVPGVAWIEHGHQYDATCSFEHGLAPHDKRGEVITNVDSASVRWLAPAAQVDPHATEEWTFGGYVRFAASLGMKAALKLFLGYAKFMLGLWASSRAQRGVVQRRRAEHLHEERLADLAEERDIPLATLREVDGLRRLPITRTMSQVCRLLLLDRIALTILTVLVAVGVGLWGGWPWGFAGMLAIAGGAYGFDRARTRTVARDPSMALAAIPEKIHRVTRTPVVVFGHTHVAMRLPLSGGAVYVNAGTWLPAVRPGLLRAFTHVLILQGKSGPEVHLRQWRDGKSRPFAEQRITPAEGMPAVAA